MNYYEHHLGDYMRDTAHLSLLEDGAYRRLMDAYYIREAPLPSDPRAVYRLVRAATKPDRLAVDTVLREFFEETPDGWRHRRCEREIERFKDKQQKARASAGARWGNRSAHQVGNANAHANASPDALRTHTEGNAPRARPQSPDTSLQTPVTKGKEKRASALAPSDLMADGLSEETSAEFIALRKRKGAALTRRAWDGIRAEAQKAGWPIEEAITKALARGWQSFEASWVMPEETRRTNGHHPAADTETRNAEAERLLRFGAQGSL